MDCRYKIRKLSLIVNGNVKTIFIQSFIILNLENFTSIKGDTKQK